MKIKPIPEVREAWRFASVQVAAAAALIGLLAPDQLAALLDFVGIGAERAPLVLGLAFILARVLQKADA
jgi:hypothetical protein